MIVELRKVTLSRDKWDHTIYEVAVTDGDQLYALAGSESNYGDAREKAEQWAIALKLEIVDLASDCPKG